VVIDQNYFQFIDKTYVQHDGLAMEVSTSSILSEFYLQHLENSKIYDILLNFNITGYFRYLDDLIIIHNERKTDIEDLLYYFNNIAPKLNFNIEKETRGSINFLDLTIHRDVNSFSIYKGWIQSSGNTAVT
jgi:hypothetical protein